MSKTLKEVFETIEAEKRIVGKEIIKELKKLKIGKWIKKVIERGEVSNESNKETEKSKSNI